MNEYLKLSRTYCMMYEATNDEMYLVKAREALLDAKLYLLIEEL